MSELPDGWKRCTIGSLCELINGRAFKPTDWSESGLPIVRIQNLNNSDAKFNRFNGEVRSRFLIDTGALLFAWSGTPGTSFGAHIWNGGPAVLNQHIFNVLFDDKTLDKHFLRLAINQKLDELIDKAHGGVGLRHVTKGKFEATEIDLPPLKDQRRIVAKLDGLFDRSEGAREELARIPRLIHRYKQAILDAAFRGDLTADWREKQIHQPAGGDPTRIDSRVGTLNALPPSWAWSALGAVADVSGGLTKNAERRSLKLRMPYLRVANVYANELRLSEVLEIGCTPTEREKRLQSGDLLIVEGNGSIEQIGRVAVWNGEVTECLHQNHIIRVRPHQVLRSKFALYWLLSASARSAIETIASSSSGLHTLSISKVQGLPIPIAPTPEMDLIVAQVETAFVAIDNVATETRGATDLLHRLDQATLAKAFRGELVPGNSSRFQTGTENPASCSACETERH